MNGSFSNDLEMVQSLQGMLIDIATGGSHENQNYTELRNFLIANPEYQNLIPWFIKEYRDISQFWIYIKREFSTYAERRAYIHKQFTKIFDHIEIKQSNPLEYAEISTLKQFNVPVVNCAWKRALTRRTTDPEGAITAARTLLETVCKYILDQKQIKYNTNKIDLNSLYKIVAKELNLSPDQHNEEIFKTILGGCSAVVNGLGTLRNRLGDAHGKGKAPVRPALRHAELAVNLSGALSLFLIQTFNERSKSSCQHTTTES
ncbi:MAG: abortive infection family protein [Desulfatibacillaceae bacterium]|nr:abortive infection family protein [Desulfatibacillaceae bacterium]